MAVLGFLPLNGVGRRAAICPFLAAECLTAKPTDTGPLDEPPERPGTMARR